MNEASLVVDCDNKEPHRSAQQTQPSDHYQARRSTKHGSKQSLFMYMVKDGGFDSNETAVVQDSFKGALFGE